MLTTCQDLVDRAKVVSTLNAPLIRDRSEMLAKIRTDQRQLFADANGAARDFFQVSDNVSSTAGVGRRRVDLSSAGPLSRPLDRILMVTFMSTGLEINQVDQLDIDAEYAPRYTVQGLSLIEVGNDWLRTGVSPVALTITYAYGPADINPTGPLTQTITLPDEWADLLVLPLAAYLVQKDPGRPDGEYERLEAMIAARRASFFEYITHFGGIEVQRFSLPRPTQAGET